MDGKKGIQAPRSFSLHALFVDERGLVACDGKVHWLLRHDGRIQRLRACAEGCPHCRVRRLREGGFVLAGLAFFVLLFMTLAALSTAVHLSQHRRQAERGFVRLAEFYLDEGRIDLSIWNLNRGLDPVEGVEWSAPVLRSGRVRVELEWLGPSRGWRVKSYQILGGH